MQVIEKDKDALYLTVFCMKENVGKVEEALRAGGFARPSQMTDQVPAKEKEELEQKVEALKQEIKKDEETIVGYRDVRNSLKVVGDYFRMRADKYQILGTIPQSQRTFLVSGYVPEKVVPAIQKAIGDNYDCVIDIEALGEEEEAPTLLENNGFSESVEGIVESYGLPKKGEIDPTTIMSFFYVFFFGMMLSDAAYGAIIAIACFVMLKKFPRMSESMHKSIKLFMYCGLSTVIWGILFGGYFGNIVDIVSQKFFGTTVTIDALWFMPLNDPMKLLVYSMLFGVIHLFVGLGIKGYLCLKDHKVMDFFCDVVLWFMLLVGLILMLLPSDIFASIAQTTIVFPPALNMLAKGLAIAGAVGIVLMSGRSSKNPGLRIALGAYDLYNKMCIRDSCYDAGFPEVARILALKGAELIFMPSAWRVQDWDMWNLNIPQRALENTLFVAGVNRFGHEGDLYMFGNSKVADWRGRIIAESKEEKEEILYADIDLKQLTKARLDIHYLKDRRPDSYKMLSEYTEY